MIKKYWFIFLLLLIEGSSLMAVELMGAKFLAPFYGSSLYVWTAVLAITILGLSLGYYFGGFLSQKRADEKTLIIIVMLAALLVFAMPLTTSVVLSLTAGMGLIGGICVAAFLLLVPPVFCFGLVGPMSVRLISHKLETVGNVSGTVYFISTFGGIAATFLFGFYYIPEIGLKFSSLITAIALAGLAVIYLFKNVLFGKPKVIPLLDEQNSHQSPGTTSSKATKKSNLRQIKNSVYLFAILEGAAVMAVELMAARMLAPWFGSSLYVWGTVIGITLLSLAFGYYSGGWLADKYSKLNTIYWVLLIASIFILFMHYFSQTFTLAFEDMHLLTALLLVGLLLILPPLLFLGMVPTMLIRYLTPKVENSGTVTGKVFTISSASGIITLPLMGFLIIPMFGITGPSIAIALAVGIIPFIKLLAQKKYIALPFVVLILISFSLTAKTNYASDDLKIKYYSEGLLGQVLVADVFKNGLGDPINDRYLFVNRIGQTNVDRSTYISNWNYITFAGSAASTLPVNSEALVLGLGGGSMANKLTNLQFNVTAIELDERIKDVAQKFFALKPNINVIVDDARHYLETTTETYDLIYFDVFIGEVQPSHVLNWECFEKAKSLLNKDGLVIINFNGFLSDEIGKAGRSVYKTLTAAGLITKILPTPGDESERNTLFLAGKKSLKFDSLRMPLLYMGNPVSLDSLFVELSDPDINDAVVFTDNQSNIDRLNARASRTWRQSYNETLTSFFLVNGVPLYH